MQVLREREGGERERESVGVCERERQREREITRNETPERGVGEGTLHDGTSDSQVPLPRHNWDAIPRVY